jgi:hypothetical protein
MRASALTVVLVSGLLALSACATPAGSASPSPVSPAPTSPGSASATPTLPPSPTPTASPTSDAPYNGDILVVTSEMNGANLEVTAMVPGVSESGGTCTLTLEATGKDVSVPGTQGKGVTYCGLMSIPVGSASGEVAFHVAYASPRLRAQSATATVEITP